MEERRLSTQGRDWYARFGELVEGPLALSGLSECLNAGMLALGTLVWREGLVDWMEAGQLPELAPIFGDASASSALSVEVLPPVRRRADRAPPILSLEEVPWGSDADVDRNRPMLRRVDAPPRPATTLQRLRRKLRRA